LLLKFSPKFRMRLPVSSLVARGSIPVTGGHCWPSCYRLLRPDIERTENGTADNP
jgi:hypothetical protein